MLGWKNYDEQRRTMKLIMIHFPNYNLRYTNYFTMPYTLAFLNHSLYKEKVDERFLLSNIYLWIMVYLGHTTFELITYCIF